MRLFRTALGIASLLIVPTAAADYTFSFNSRGHADYAGGSSGADGAAFSGAGSVAGSLGGGKGDAGNLASLSSLAATSPYLAATSGGAVDGDNALDCVDSTSTVPDAPRATQSCWLVSLAASQNNIPLAGKATDAYPLASPGSRDWNDWYQPTSFGGPPSNGGSPSGNRTSGGGGSAGAPTASTSDGRIDTTSGPTTDPFHFRSGSDGRGGDIISLGETTPSTHHRGRTSGGDTSGDDTSTPPIDTSLVTGTDSVVPTHHRGRDPVSTTVVDPATAASTLNTPVDQVLTGPSVNVSVAPQPIPEPGTLVLVGLALVAIAVMPKSKR